MSEHQHPDLARARCNAVSSQLPLWAGGDLEAPELAEIDRHLEHCASCTLRAEAARASRARYQAAALVELEPQASLWPGLRATLAGEGRFQPRATPAERPLCTRRPALRALPRWVVGLASAAALVAVVALFERGQDSAGSDPLPLPAGPETPAAGGTTGDPLAGALEQEALPLLPAGLRHKYLGQERLADGARSLNSLPHSLIDVQGDPNTFASNLR